MRHKWTTEELIREEFVKLLELDGAVPRTNFLQTISASKRTLVSRVIDKMVSEKAITMKLRKPKHGRGRATIYYQLPKVRQVLVPEDFDQNPPVIERREELTPVTEETTTFYGDAFYIAGTSDGIKICPAKPSGAPVRERLLEEQLASTEARLVDMTQKYEEVAGLLKALRDLSL